MNPRILHDLSFIDKGITYIAGIDEAGRGPLAGPLVVAVVVLDLNMLKEATNGSATNNDMWSQINDSKLLAPQKRENLYEFIKFEAISYSIIEIDIETIDTNGIGKANATGFNLAIQKLKIIPEHFLTDYFRISSIAISQQTNLVKGDRTSLAIGAASILAKVYRDKLMEKMHKKYPLYGFDRHKGYATKAHIEAIFKHGICDIHRKSFKVSNLNKTL